MSNGISSLPRNVLAAALGGDTRAVRAFEEEAANNAETADKLAANVDATESINDATVLVLSPNAAFNNERVLKLGEGIRARDNGAELTISVDDRVPHVLGGFAVNITATQATQVQTPVRGLLATQDQPETLSSKVLEGPMLTDIAEYATEDAAVAANLPVGTIYTVLGTLKLRRG